MKDLPSSVSILVLVCLRKLKKVSILVRCDSCRHDNYLKKTNETYVISKKT